MLPLLAITLGDPGGIGAEVIVKALADDRRRSRARFRVYGRPEPLALACARAGISEEWLAQIETESAGVHSHPWVAAPTTEGGDASFRWVEAAIADALTPRSHPKHVDGVVTGPISKHAWALAGHSEFPGHTELFAKRCNAGSFAMMFHAPPSESALTTRAGLNVILTTVHIPLKDVPSRITAPRILETISLGARAMRDFGYEPARIAVCGLNPHAGEEGLLGDEDHRIIAPAVAQARAAGFDAQGPFPADTIFTRALEYPRRRAEFDLVVAMYHDQGLIPLKTLAWDRAVNLTVGLPIVRTSPDHGTAFNIVGQSIANEGSMGAAIDAAVLLAGHHT
ncbi:MAG: 4-hydroxythreonine-4-phosphate dehydrogenase PdxA [Phycisphaerales bacterium]